MQRRAKKELFGPHMIVIAMLVARKRLVEDFENLHLTFCYLLFSDHFSEFFTSPILVQTISLSPLYLWSVHCNPSQVQRRSLVFYTLQDERGHQYLSNGEGPMPIDALGAPFWALFRPNFAQKLTLC